MSDQQASRLERLTEVVEAIDQIDGRQAFLVPEDAQSYNAYKLSSTNLGATRLSTHDREMVETYGTDLTDISFNRVQDNPEVHNAISDYRRAVMKRLRTDLQALEAVFQAKLVKKDHHKNVLRAQAALQSAVDNAEPLLDNLSDSNIEAAIAQLNLAINAMQKIAQNYISGSDRQNRIQARIDACQNVLDRLDQLTVTDDKIINGRLDESFRAFENARSALFTIKPEAARTFGDAMETMFFNASPEATAQTAILDSLGVALGLAKLDSSVTSSSDLGTADAIAPDWASTASPLL
ncbi:MAG: hypothetical protein HC781_03370 [Leptolyngbyaceae cyanobacterium CSU_1_4]|nr:hypothetical protein [Leptolyngbyaceae cyanobacterium CSU_1_4]